MGMIRHASTLLLLFALAFAVGQPETAPTDRNPNRYLFSNTSADGGVVIARSGDVLVSEAHGCPGARADTSARQSRCKSHRPGVTFDFSAPGLPWYRLVALIADYQDARADSASVRPVSIATAYRTIQRDGSSTTANPDRVHISLVAFRTKGVAKVRVRLSSGRRVLLRPVRGWAAVAHRGTTSAVPFRVRIEGLDSSGRVVAKAVAFRCC